MLGRMLCFINGRKFFPIKLTDGKVILTSILFKIYQLLEILRLIAGETIKMIKSHPSENKNYNFNTGCDIFMLCELYALFAHFDISISSN
jgi:hypothetical protein